MHVNHLLDHRDPRLSAEERAEAIAKTAVVYDQFRDLFTPGLVDAIRAAK